MNAVLFHAKDFTNNVKKPKYTLYFKKHDKNLLLTYSKPHKGIDSYSKKEGNKICFDKMNNLTYRLEDEKFKQRTTELLYDKIQLKELLPYDIVCELIPYVNRAVEIITKQQFEMEKLIFRSDRRTNRICEIYIRLLNM